MAVDRPRTLFLGMTGTFSLGVLRVFLAEGMPVAGVVVAGEGQPHQVGQPPRPSGLPLLTQFAARSIVHEAWDGGIPVLETGRGRWSELESLVNATCGEVDVIAVACFPWLIPAPFRALARIAAVNVHPSLLPDNRGPEPLFWTFRLGRSTTGVSVHLLTDEADAGDILMQEEVALTHGVRGPDLERQCAETGGHLLARSVVELTSGAARAQRQDPSLATNYGVPANDDWAIPTGWDAMRAYDFIRGVAHLQGPLRISLAREDVRVIDAIGVEPDTVTGAPVMTECDVLAVQFSRGVLTVKTHQ